MKLQDIINFWFQELNDRQRFAKDEMLDSAMRARFGQMHKAAVAGELFMWRATAEGRLAEIVVLDQFSRNMFRDTPSAFAQDTQALTLAQELVANGHDQKLPIEQRIFAYMPFMHSESNLIHEQAVLLYSQPGMEGALAFEQRHKVIIERFGRFPHRNAILGRASTPQERAFLETPGSSF
jgi:uncharacterized protein (DUF924 family)